MSLCGLCIVLKCQYDRSLSRRSQVGQQARQEAHSRVRMAGIVMLVFVGECHTSSLWKGPSLSQSWLAEVAASPVFLMCLPCLSLHSGPISGQIKAH